VKTREDGDQSARKTREAALIVPVLGFLLLTPPFAQVFSIDSSVLGVPTIVVYVFSVWIGLIVIAFWLSKRLSRSEPPRPPEG